MEKIIDAAKATGGWSADKLFQFFGGLFMEKKDVDGDGNAEWIASLGRVAFWVVFAHVMYVFNTEGKTLAAEELNVFYALLGYQGVKLGKDMVTGTVEAWKGPAKDE